MIAAVGSFIIFNTLSPAFFPALIVAWRCASLKYAGTVITAPSILTLLAFSMSFTNSFKYKPDKSSDVYVLPSINIEKFASPIHVL